MDVAEINIALEMLRKSPDSNYKIAGKTGLSQSSIGKWKKGEFTPSPVNARVLMDYFEGKEAKPSSGHKLTTPEGFRLVPMYNMDARGGFGDNDEADCLEYVIDHVPFKDAKSGDICLPITGDSMMPKYSAGTIALLHEVPSWRDFLEFGQVYVIILNDGRRLLKELRPSEEDKRSNYLCASHNPSFAPVELPKQLIQRVYLVTAVYAKTTM